MLSEKHFLFVPGMEGTLGMKYNFLFRKLVLGGQSKNIKTMYGVLANVFNVDSEDIKQYVLCGGCKVRLECALPIKSYLDGLMALSDVGCTLDAKKSLERLFR